MGSLAYFTCLHSSDVLSEADMVKSTEAGLDKSSSYTTHTPVLVQHMPILVGEH